MGGAAVSEARRGVIAAAGAKRGGAGRPVGGRLAPGAQPAAVHRQRGRAAPAAALAPKCSPIGMPPKKVGEDIQKATKDWKGIKVEVEIKVQNKQSEVRVLDTAGPLILKALKEPARDRKKTKK